jgi:hypothetical protein
MSFFDGPDTGDVLRLRNFRRYSSDGRSWVDYSLAKRGELKDNKKVFIALLLGIEPMVQEKKSADYELFFREYLRPLGYVHVDEAEEAGADVEKLGFEPIKPKPKPKKTPKVHKHFGKRTLCGREVTHTTQTTRKWADVDCKRCLAQRG